MAALSDQVTKLVQHESGWLQKVAQYAFQAPGKQVRSMLVFLGAGVCGGITAKTLRGAVLVTLLHQVSLTHDDVVDEATHRRGKPSINVVWNNKVAVLLGDYLWAKSLHIATQHQDYDLLALIIETAQAMSQGELLQLAQANDFDTTEKISLDIIYQKTAQLFGTCLAVGAITAGASEVQVANMRRAGTQIGMAFQLKDDWLDYGTENQGKPLGMDLKEGKLTLPLIHALKQAPAQQQREILKTIKHARYHPRQHQEALDFVRQSPGMDYTRKIMLQYQKKALKTLINTTPSSYQQALVTLIQQII